MRLLWLLTGLLCLGGPAAAAKNPDVQVLESTARRLQAGKVVVDGSIKIGAKPVRGLIVIFDFLSSENETLSSQKIQVARGALIRGEESSFHAETSETPGAVRYRLRAFTTDERELRVGNAGPFTIE